MSLVRVLLGLILVFGYVNALHLEDLGFDISIVSKNKEYKISKYKIKNKELQDYKLKIITNKILAQKEIYYLKIYCDINSIINANVKFQSELKNIIIKIDKKTPEKINIFFHNKEQKKINIIVYPIHSFEFESFYEYRNVITGISYGIIFCAFLYSLIMYINIHFRSLLYYSLMQLMLLLTLLQDYYISSTTYLISDEKMITDYFSGVTVILVMLFSKEVLVFKNNNYFIKNIFKIAIVLNIIDLLLIYFFKGTILYEIIPLYIFVFLLFSLGTVSAFQGFKFSFFYVAGWSVLFISLLINEYNLFYLSDAIVLNIGLPLESLILSVALGYKLKDIIEEKKEEEQLLIQQSKLASMGNMINNIAHQWRQPLSNLSFINMDLKLAIQTNDVNNEYLKTVTQGSSKQIDFMSKTLDNFTGFYQPKRDKEIFFISAAVHNAINIIEQTLKDNKIILDFKIENDKEIISYENEYSQIILNILSNANDALLHNKIENPYIKILLFTNGENISVLRICDNAKGINTEIIHKIFDPYFTTKKNNTGIGLYMSKIIAKSHLKAELTVKNSSFGACFEIKL